MLQEIESFELLPNMASNAISNSHRTTEDSSTSLKKEIEDAFGNNFNNQVRGKFLIAIDTVHSKQFRINCNRFEANLYFTSFSYVTSFHFQNGVGMI